jgi:pimeloyl-ACP methyl ester carboxylesterase
MLQAGRHGIHFKGILGFGEGQEYLEGSYRVVVPDLRGYGKSSLPAGSRETRLGTFAADTTADRLGARGDGAIRPRGTYKDDHGI